MQTIRFGAFTPSQMKKIDAARQGSKKEEPSKVLAVLDAFLPPPKADLSQLPAMPQDFADKLAAAIKKRFTNDLLGSLPERTNTAYRKELADVVERLEKAPFVVADKVAHAIEKAYGETWNPETKSSRW